MNWDVTSRSVRQPRDVAEGRNSRRAWLEAGDEAGDDSVAVRL